MKTEAEEFVSKAPNGRWRYYRRVPTEVQSLVNKVHVKVSLKTKDHSIAVERAKDVHAKFKDEWGTLAAQMLQWPAIEPAASESQEEKPVSTHFEEFQSAKKFTESLGFTYRPWEEVLRVESDEKIERRTLIELFLSRGGDPSEIPESLGPPRGKGENR